MIVAAPIAYQSDLSAERKVIQTQQNEAWSLCGELMSHVEGGTCYALQRTRGFHSTHHGVTFSAPMAKTALLSQNL